MSFLNYDMKHIYYTIYIFIKEKKERKKERKKGN